MPQMSRKIKPTRTTNGTEDMENSIKETEVEVIRSSQKESVRIKKLRATPKDPDFPTECVRRPHNQFC